MKKLLILFIAMLPLLNSCEKTRELDDKMEGQSGATNDGYGLNQKELEQVQAIGSDIRMEMRKGDSLTIIKLKEEIDVLKAEVHELKNKK